MFCNYRVCCRSALLDRSPRWKAASRRSWNAPGSVSSGYVCASISACSSLLSVFQQPHLSPSSFDSSSLVVTAMSSSSSLSAGRGGMVGRSWPSSNTTLALTAEQSVERAAESSSVDSNAWMLFFSSLTSSGSFAARSRYHAIMRLIQRSTAMRP
ncbi:hypothetical protein BD626DRAFT_521900 [Schizophyllum amplum]|uniref:Uncharacterized protein n=1 Tax=Schizophyllum amplum TaxID=97359 RepID=A0A550BTH8_9AGAR|nr:hypothetical protein BD626DRAFT_521900 [Auriculariopsis ampla]